MTIFAIGIGDHLVLPRLTRNNNVFGSETLYSHPNTDWCYSKHGFAFPLDGEGVSFAALMDNQLPSIPIFINKLEREYNYLLIDHNANLWKIVVSDSSEGQNLAYLQIQNHPDSWWMSFGGNKINFESDSLLGLLRTLPTKEKLQEYFLTYHQGERRTWMSISHIVEKLHTLFPLPETTAQDRIALRMAKKILHEVEKVLDKTGGSPDEVTRIMAGRLTE